MSMVMLVLMALATARITRLVTEDVLTEDVRAWTIMKLNGWPRIQYLMECPWCASMYAGAAVSAGWVTFGDNRWFVGALAVFATSHITGWLAQNGKGE